MLMYRVSGVSENCQGCLMFWTELIKKWNFFLQLLELVIKQFGVIYVKFEIPSRHLDLNLKSGGGILLFSTYTEFKIRGWTCIRNTKCSYFKI